MVLFLAVVICCFVTGHISKSGGNSYFLGFFNTIFLAILGAIVLPIGSASLGFVNTSSSFIMLGGFIGLVLSVVLALTTGKKSTCPSCAEKIKPEAIKCKHCGSVVNA